MILFFNAPLPLTASTYRHSLSRHPAIPIAALVAAHFPRAYHDPNRSSTDNDPRLVDGRWPWPVEPSEKARFGHGLIWRICPPDLQMYDRSLTVSELRHRIETYYRPYHKVLRQTLDALYRRFGKVWQVNCHSMPSISGPHSPEIGRAHV